MENRIKTLREIIQKENLDAVLISSVANIIYYSDFHSFSPLERDGYVMITRKNAYIITSSLYADAVKESIHHLDLEVYSAKQSLLSLLENISITEKIASCGFEADNLTVAELKRLQTLPLRFKVVNLGEIRILKSNNEIKKIQKACTIGDSAFREILQVIKPGMTEKELAFLLETEMRKSGAEIAFPTIAAFGKNAAVPHHHSGETKLKKNDLILLDFGAKYNGYCSDMSRTVYIGKVTAQQKRLYETVLKAQQKAVDFINRQLTGTRSNDKIAAAEVDAAARDYVISQGYPSIPHSLGHGIGIEVHELPHISPNSQENLENGMVFSIEPGIYLPGLAGVRIEDLYAVQNNHLIRLTNTSSDLLQI